MENLTDAEAVRFAAKYVRQGDCWTWQGPLDRDGYGTFYLRGTNRRAHRVAWYARNGEIPEGFVINHTCRNRACVNPQHLQSITVRENALLDSASLGYINSQKETCAKGHPFDKVASGSGGRAMRVCSVCDRARRTAAAKRRRQAAKASLSV